MCEVVRRKKHDRLENHRSMNEFRGKRVHWYELTLDTQFNYGEE